MEITSESFEKYVKDFHTLNKFMYKVIEKKVDGPFYGFEDEEENTDNYWWTDSDPRYELLKNINSVGNFISTNAEEGDLTPNPVILNKRNLNWRCVLSGIFKNDDHFKTELFARILEERGYIVLTGIEESKINKEIMERYPINQFSDDGTMLSGLWIERGKNLTYSLLESTPINSFLSKKKIRRNVEFVEFEIVDRRINYPCHFKDGLFSDVLKTLEYLEREKKICNVCLSI